MFALFLMLLGFTSAFSFTSWTPIPMILGILLVFGYLLKSLTLGKVKIEIIDWKQVTVAFSLVIIFIVGLSMQMLSLGYETKGLTHFFSYITTFLIFYFGIYLYLTTFDFSIEKIMKYITIGVILTSAFTVFEFLTRNFTSLNIDELVYRSNVQYYEATYRISGMMFHRARGPIEESGHLAMYLLMFIPFVIYYYKNYQTNKLKRNISYLLVISALITTFSAAGLADIAVACLVVGLLKIFSKKVKTVKITTAISFCFSFPVLLLFLVSNSHLFQGIINKLSFSDSSSSAQSRVGRWESALLLVKEKLFLGHGPGATSIIYGTGSTSFYLEFLTAFGIIGIFILLVFLLHNLKLILKLPQDMKYTFLFSYVIAITHYFIISNYWYPWLWVLIAILQFVIIRTKKEPV